MLLTHVFFFVSALSIFSTLLVLYFKKRYQNKQSSFFRWVAWIFSWASAIVSLGIIYMTPNNLSIITPLSCSLFSASLLTLYDPLIAENSEIYFKKMLWATVFFMLIAVAAMLFI